MSVTAVEIVKKRTNALCHATVCRDGRCSLSLEDVPEPSVLISLEHEAAPVKADQARCDYASRIGIRTWIRFQRRISR